jgi:phage/plasmid-like protein (TIGR03299 family)
VAHELSINSAGQAEAFYTLTPAWHGLGVVVKDAPNSQDAIRLARLDWEVVQQPVYTNSPQQTLIAGIDGDMEKIEGWRANVRKDTGAVLGVVSSRYSVIQNVEAFDFVDALVQDGIVKYESAGAMRGGRVVWLLARMPGRSEVAEGDELQRFILFTNTHDGSRAALILPTSVRVVCMNTLRLALSKGRGKALKIRHTGDIDAKIDEARAAMGIADSQFADNLETSRKLAARRLEHTEFIAYLDTLIPLPADHNANKRATTQRNEVRAKIKDLYYLDKRQTLPGVEKTAWAALNAVTQYVDHSMTTRGETAKQRAENAFYSVTMGHGNDIKQEAYRTAIEMFA